MEPAVAVLAWGGPVAVAIAWLVVRSGRSIWMTMALVMAPLGILTLVVATPRGAEAVGTAAAAGLGVVAGVVLYAATAAFMFLVRGWPLLARHAAELYDQRRRQSLGVALALAALVVASGEELLWRGVVQEALAGRLGDVQGAVAAWGTYVAVNGLSGSLPITLGAAVGGTVWAALVLATGGVLASILCHGVWTALMIARPPLFSMDGAS
jgi:membrane protease YdiL (CAAX protease family)